MIASRTLDEQPLDEARVLAVLDGIRDPCSLATQDPLGLAEMGLIERVDVGADGDVHVAMRLTSPTCIAVGYFTTECQSRIGELPGVRTVDVSFDAGLDWDPSHMSEAVRRRRAARFAAR